MSASSNAGLHGIAETTNQFANNFLKTVANEKHDNLISSPLSVQVVLAMAAYGAKGKTANQIRSALRIPINDDAGQSGYQSLIEALNDPKGVELRLGNKIYTSIQANIKPAYKELTAKKFLSSSQEVDFNDAEDTAITINAWCEEQTNKCIKEVISPDTLSSETMLVLVNAVYFKGQWQQKFRTQLTRNQPFHVNETTIINVPTMFIETKLRYGDLPELSARFIEIPYQGGEFNMIVIRPNEINGLGTVLDNLNKVNLTRSLYPEEVKLFLPKFRIESTLNLKAASQNMGMTDMFDDRVADFSGIAETPLKVSHVIQKAYIEVDEEGSEAAAATGLEYVPLCYRPIEVFDVNRPFYYEIRLKNQYSDLPIFAGFYTAKADR